MVEGIVWEQYRAESPGNGPYGSPCNAQNITQTLEGNASYLSPTLRPRLYPQACRASLRD